MNLQEIMRLIDSQYAFTEKAYPKIAKLDADERVMFAVKHSLFHMQKSLGKISDVLEKNDHTGTVSPGDIDKLRQATVKMFINTVKLASELGYSAETFLQAVESFYKKQ